MLAGGWNYGEAKSLGQQLWWKFGRCLLDWVQVPKWMYGLQHVLSFLKIASYLCFFHENSLTSAGSLWLDFSLTLKLPIYLTHGWYVTFVCLLVYYFCGTPSCMPHV